VITWMAVQQTLDDEFTGYFVYMTATPDLGTGYSMVETLYSRCPDVACFQTYGADQYVAFSYYFTEDMDNDPWLVWTKSFQYEIDNGQAVFTDLDSVDVDGSNGWWGLSEENIFTGSTLCLQHAADDPAEATFGLGWIDTSACDVYTANGQIP